MQAQCSILNCEKPAEKRGWCGMHYRRWQRYGDTSANPRIIDEDWQRAKGQLPTEFICECCGVTFTPRRISKGRSLPRFCSTACRTHPMSLEDRFWEKVNKDGPVIREELGPCHIWTAGGHTAGYGEFSMRIDGVWVPRRATHVAYEIHEGHPVPDGLWLLHKCDNPPCVRFEHLFLGNALTNMVDMRKKGRGTSILTPSEVLAIRQRFDGGESLTSLGKAFGVSRPAISRIAHRKGWTHV